MIYAIIENNVVTNRIVADEKFIKQNKLNAVLINNDDVQIGASYIEGVFVNPTPTTMSQQEYEKLLAK